MAITFVGKTNGGENVASFSHTAGSGSNRLLVVLIALRSSVDNVTGVTYGGVAMTRANNAAGNGMEADIWYLVNPASGANTVAISGLASPDDDYHAVAVDFAGVLQTSPVDDFDDGTGTGSNPSITSIPTVDGELLVGVLSSEDGSAPATGAGETNLFNNDDGTWSNGFSYAIQTTAGSQAINWTAAADSWAGATATFKAAPTTANSERAAKTTGDATANSERAAKTTGDGGTSVN